ncbi:hypothetical protein MIND_00410000 [Mycena indigotica]|uniref:Uncharacterized protein n=1 Tax=Mycena indigotica TaxID=2126181 RepID=A0A8H6W7V0_9AGAR|nr:uncharacterized protein MIND_00410000 [Mycena indigotica]KAF7306196.1 hypothetical protein MIND_00410000 [Mycena indigotica]
MQRPLSSVLFWRPVHTVRHPDTQMQISPLAERTGISPSGSLQGTLLLRLPSSPNLRLARHQARGPHTGKLRGPGARVLTLEDTALGADNLPDREPAATPRVAFRRPAVEAARAERGPDGGRGRRRRRAVAAGCR